MPMKWMDMHKQKGLEWRARASAAALAGALAAAAPQVAAAQSAQGTVTPQAYSDERISMQKGEFLAGTWAADSGVTLDLLDAAGRHVRRLSDHENPPAR